MCSPSSLSQFILTSSSHLSANREPTIWAILLHACYVWFACTILVRLLAGKYRRWYLGTPFLLLLQRNRSNITSSALNQRFFLLLGALDPPKSWTFPNLLPRHLISLSRWMSIVPFNMWQTQNCRWIRKKGRGSVQTSSHGSAHLKKAPRCWLSKALSLKQEIPGQRDNLDSRRNLRHQAQEKKMPSC